MLEPVAALGVAGLSLGPPPPQDPSPLRGTLGSSLRSPAEGKGNEGFPPPPEEDLERVAQGVSGPSSSCVWNPRVFADKCNQVPTLQKVFC